MGSDDVTIITATLRATAAIAIRMIKEENDLDLLKAILRTIKSSVFNPRSDYTAKVIFLREDKLPIGHLPLYRIHDWLICIIFTQ